MSTINFIAPAVVKSHPMNFESRIDNRIWAAIQSSIEARNFKAAILDAIQLLGDVIRERSGLDSDGVALIGEAFGGTAPLLKVNKLQSESDKNIQRGTDFLLRGLFQAIRNPRSHSQHQDDDRDAYAIISFIDFLLRIVDQTRSPFSLPTFIARLIDPDFVPNKNYANLLVQEIPLGQRLAVCREAFLRHDEMDPHKLKLFFSILLEAMSPEETDEFAAHISEELRVTDKEGAIRFVLGALPTSNWLKIAEVARLRVENKLIKSVMAGRWISDKSRCVGGGLGTWAPNILQHLLLKNELWNAVFEKLISSDRDEQEYAFRFFMNRAEECFPTPPPGLIWRIIKGLESGDIRFKNYVSTCVSGSSNERPADHPWAIAFADHLAKFTEIEPDTSYGDDDVPF